MTIPFLPEEHKQRALLGVLGAVVLLGLGLAWYIFLREPALPAGSMQPPPPKPAELNFEVFEDPAFRELGAPQRVIPVPEEVGKRNPFVPQQ